MEGNKAYRFFYLIFLFIFAVSGAALAVRMADLHRGSEFYEQLGGAGNTGDGGISAKQPQYAVRVSRLAKKYPGFAGWLQIPDTSIDYPVMLGEDNEYYLNHLPDGSKNALGSLFLDCRTDRDSVHFIIYGHNGADGSMFGLLKQYESEDYFKEHPFIQVMTEEALYSCPIFSVRRVEAGGDAYRLEFKDADALKDYIMQAGAESCYPIEGSFGNAARILTLSTCTGRNGQRLVVQAVLPER